jgi:hypothetical protein
LLCILLKEQKIHDVHLQGKLLVSRAHGDRQFFAAKKLSTAEGETPSGQTAARRRYSSTPDQFAMWR